MKDIGDQIFLGSKRPLIGFPLLNTIEEIEAVNTVFIFLTNEIITSESESIHS